MNLNKFLSDNKLDTLPQIKTTLSSPPYSMDVKGNEERCILRIKGTITKFTKEADGCIIDIPNMKVICYFPYFSRIELKYQDNQDEKFSDEEWNNTVVEELIDGTVIRLYYDTEWKIATLHTIDAENAYWVSDKSFKTLFLECSENLVNFDILNKSYIYGFIIRHPENKIVTHYELKDVVHIETLDRDNNFELVDVDLKIIKPRKLIFTNYSQMINSCIKLHFYLPGYLLSKNGNLTKYLAPHYNYVKSLKGNTPNMEIRYLQIRTLSPKDQYSVSPKNEFISVYFPEFLILADNIEKRIVQKTSDIFRKYVDIKIRKRYYELDQIEKQLIYKIHESYLTTSIPITSQKVYDIFNSFPYYKIALALKIQLNKNPVKNYPTN